MKVCMLITLIDAIGSAAMTIHQHGPEDCIGSKCAHWRICRPDYGYCGLSGRVPEDEIWNAFPDPAKEVDDGTVPF